MLSQRRFVYAYVNATLMRKFPSWEIYFLALTVFSINILQ